MNGEAGSSIIQWNIDLKKFNEAGGRFSCLIFGEKQGDGSCAKSRGTVLVPHFYKIMFLRNEFLNNVSFKKLKQP